MQTGKVSKQADGFMVKYERILPHPVDVVWDAITNPDKLKIWFTDIEMEFKEGGTMKIYFADEARTVSHGKILKINKPSVFQFSWEEELATWELFPEGKSSTKLVFTYSKLPENYAISVTAGWHVVLDQLETVLDGHTKAYPFGAGPSLKGKALQAEYSKTIVPEFPELKKYVPTDAPVMVEKIYHSPIEKVWKALTDKNQMKQWYFDVPDFKPEVGNVFEFSSDHDGKIWVHRCRVTEVIPLSKISYTWTYVGYEGESEVSFELYKHANGTRLVLIHAGVETFPADVKALRKENFVEGWNANINTILAEYLEKQIVSV